MPSPPSSLHAYSEVIDQIGPCPAVRCPKRSVIQTLPWLSMARPLVLKSGLEFLGLARIGGRKARHVVDDAIGYPNPVLLVDRKEKRCL